MSNKRNPNDVTVGISPLGGNSVEGTADGFAPVVDASVQAVPLVYDPRVGAYISEQAVDELDDRDASRETSEQHRKEDEYRAKIGFRRSIEQ